MCPRVDYFIESVAVVSVQQLQVLVLTSSQSLIFICDVSTSFPLMVVSCFLYCFWISVDSRDSKEIRNSTIKAQYGTKFVSKLTTSLACPIPIPNIPRCNWRAVFRKCLIFYYFSSTAYYTQHYVVSLKSVLRSLEYLIASHSLPHPIHIKIDYKKW